MMVARAAACLYEQIAYTFAHSHSTLDRSECQAFAHLVMECCLLGQEALSWRGDVPAWPVICFLSSKSPVSVYLTALLLYTMLAAIRVTGIG